MPRKTVAYIRRETVPGVPPEKFQESIFGIEMEMLVDVFEDGKALDNDDLALAIGHEVISYYHKVSKEKYNAIVVEETTRN